MSDYKAVYPNLSPYEDDYNRRIAENIRDFQRKGQILVPHDYNFFGIPRITDLEYAPANHKDGHTYSVGAYGWLDFDREVSGAMRFTPKDGGDIPPALADYRPIGIAQAVVWPGRRIAVIDTGETRVEIPDIPVYIPPYRLLKEINRRLTAARAYVFAWKFTIQEDDPVGDLLYPGHVPTVSNGETRAIIAGYVADDASGTLVYMSALAHRMSLESIRASLKRGKRVQVAGFDAMYPPENTIVQMQYCYDLSSHHAVFLNSRAAPGKWSPTDDKVYALVFHGDTDRTPDEVTAALRRQVVVRLNEALPIPVLTEWADALWQPAVDAGYIATLTAIGDCVAAVSIDVSDIDGWKDLIEHTLKAQAISIA